MFCKHIIFLAATILTAGTVAQAQDCNTDWLGTKTLYAAPAYRPSTVPAGYQPVFINHVGRHGARHLTKEVNTSFTWKLLHRADSAKALTPAGENLWRMVQALTAIEKGQVKSISDEGRTELKGIGERMYKHYPSVFTGKVDLNVGYTKEIRTKQSAEAFLQGLKVGFKDSASVKDYNDDTDLRFYDSSPVYTAFEESGSWEKPMNALRQSVKIEAVNHGLAVKWLQPAFLKTLKPAEEDKLASDVFGFATIAYSLQTEIKKAGYQWVDVDFKPLFTCAELTALSKVDIAEDYLKKAPGTNVNGIQVRIAVPLLVNFINTTDEFIKTGKPNAQLRLAHAETISPFATLLGLTGAATVAKDMNNIEASWKSSAIIPLSSNIQWIFYRKAGSADLLVKFLLNEREVRIAGLKSATVYYHWKDVRAFYIAKLNKLNVGLRDDMAAYLKDVK